MPVLLIFKSLKVATPLEAVSQQETSEVPEGQVVQQVRKGYRLRDRLLRPASVVVAKKPAEAASLAS